MMVNRGYGNVQPTRRALDVITFLSFSQFRKEALRSDETETLRAVIAALSPELRDEGTVTALIGALEQCNSR
jgi:membrane-bound lytic murein transglycosylase B